MKKIWLLALIITGTIVNECLSITWNENNNSEQKNIEFANETDDVWTPTLQLCWNELIDLTGTPQIQYINGNPPLADKLNQQKFFKDDLNSNDYYTSVGKMTIKHKNKIADKSGKEEMILYLTSSEASFDDIYNEILTKAKNKENEENEEKPLSEEKIMALFN